MDGAGRAGGREEEEQEQVQLQSEVHLQPPGVGGEDRATAHPSPDTWIESRQSQASAALHWRQAT